MADKKERVDRGAAIKLLDRAAALEMARKTNWLHDFSGEGGQCRNCKNALDWTASQSPCPAKIADALLEVQKRGRGSLESNLLARYVEAFPNYEWVDGETSIDLMVAEIKALRHELGNAQQTIVKTSLREAAEAAEREKEGE